ncbi:MAG TPA: F0F1 ATP synthase subunit B [Caldilineae bacterium]|nr:F0F1 ATP synthase subunit B [Caldilineae bacterium]
MSEVLGGLGINGPFLLAQIINFLILFGALSVLLWKPLMQRLDARREMLRKQQEDAEAIAQARAEMEKEREQILGEARAEANRLLAEARGQAREIVEQATAQARQEAEQLLVQARRDAEEERNLLLGQMREQIAALAIAAAHRLIGEALDERRQRTLVDAFFSGVREGRVEVLPEGTGPAHGPVTIISAIPLSEAEQATIRSELTRQLDEEWEMSFQVDPQILGGLVVRVGDRVIDGSFAGQLERLRQTLV